MTGEWNETLEATLTSGVSSTDELLAPLLSSRVYQPKRPKVMKAMTGYKAVKKATNIV